MTHYTVSDVWTITARTERVTPKNPDDWNISEIEAIPEYQAAEMAEETAEIKGHNVYFVQLGKYFGYSALVYYNGHDIHYVNDYELHHKTMEKSELHDWYVKSLNSKLYTEEELAAPLESYGDYERRKYFLRNYYPMRYNYVSHFGNFNSEQYTELYKAVTADMYDSRIAFCWFESPEIPERIAELDAAIEAARAGVAENFDYWYKGFYHEFFNYECMIGGRYDEAAAAVLNGAKPNETIQAAYKKAKKDFLAYCDEHDLY